MSKLVQYIIVSSELQKVLHRPLSAIIGNCCQAVLAVGQRYRDDHANRQFLNDVCDYSANSVVVEVKNETDLLLLSANLKRDQLKYEIWLDDETNKATCVALKPYSSSEIPIYIKELELFQ